MEEIVCPYCGRPDGVFICSFGAYNCADCGTAFQPGEVDELQIDE